MFSGMRFANRGPIWAMRFGQCKYAKVWSSNGFFCLHRTRYATTWFVRRPSFVQTGGFVFKPQADLFSNRRWSTHIPHSWCCRHKCYCHIEKCITNLSKDHVLLRQGVDSSHGSHFRDDKWKLHFEQWCWHARDDASTNMEPISE